MRDCRAALVTILLVACGGLRRELAPIRLVAVTTLGATDGDGAIATTPVVSARSPDGYRVVVPAASAIGTAPLLFADDGHFLGTLHGDSSAAGTFGGPMFTRLGPGDSIWVFDNSARALIFNRAQRYVRTISLPQVAWDALILGDNRFVATGDSAGTAQLYDASGTAIRVFGAEPPKDSNDNPQHLVFGGSNGTFWTSTVSHRWLLEQWDTGGQRLRVIEPNATWFPAAPLAGRSDSAVALRPPPPRIVAVWSDRAGRLWVLGEIADRRWQRGLAPHDSASAGSVTVADEDKYYDSIVEVREPVAGRLIASARFDVHCSSIAEPGMLVHQIVTSAGWQRAELLQVEFHGSETAPRP